MKKRFKAIITVCFLIVALSSFMMMSPAPSIADAYPVSYYGNGNTSGNIPQHGAWNSGDEVKALENTGSLARTGYAFAGWNTAPDGKGQFVKPGSVIFEKGAEFYVMVDLYAQWSVNYYAVTYDGNGNASGAVPSGNKFPYGSTVKVQGNTGSLARNGYTFDGWNTEPEGNGTSYASGKTFDMPAFDMRLYAQWRTSEQSIIVSISPGNAAIGKAIDISASLRSDGGTLEGRMLIFELNGEVVGTSVTDSEGLAEVNGIRVTLDPGYYSVIVYYEEDGIRRAEGTAELNVLRGGGGGNGFDPTIIIIICAGTLLVGALLWGIFRKKPGKAGSEKRGSKKELPGPVKGDYFSEAELPLHCIINEKVYLTVRLSKGTKEFARCLGVFKSLVPAGTKSITLHAIVTSAGFAFSEEAEGAEIKSKPIILKLDGESNEIKFEMVPKQIGRQSTEVELFYEGRRIDYLLLSTIVGETNPQKADLDPAIHMESPLKNLNLMRADKKREMQTLHVNYDEKENSIEYNVYSKETETPVTCKIELPNSRDEIVERIRDFTDFLNSVVVYGEKTEQNVWDDIYFTLEAKCENLFAFLMPDEVRTVIKGWKSGSTCVVSTNEQLIPWEVFYDGDEFLGKKFVLARCPRLAYEKGMPKQDRHIGTSLDIEQIINVVGGGLDEKKGVKQDAQKLFDSIQGVKVTLLVEESIADLYKATTVNEEGTDMIHFTCHGFVDPPMLQIAKDKTEFQNLNLDSITKLRIKPGCFIFANACYSNSVIDIYKSITSFGWEFYKNGADIYLGTIAQVPDTEAVKFAESIYQELISNNSTIGQALYSVKNNEAAARKNINWLMYSVYGNPDTRLTFKR